MDNVYDKEAFVVAFLNTKNRVIDHEVVSVGTINSSLVHPREVFRNAIVNKANSVILCHNHPSGDLTPSKEDISITQRLKETGNLLGIRVLDHLIINGVNQHEVYSFQAQGVMEKEEAYNAPTSVLNEETNYRFTKEEDEQRFFDSDVNSYAIYQLKGGEDLRDFRFEGLEKLERAGLSVEYDNYDLIYTSPLTDFNGDKNHVLNKLYEQFNINHPDNFKGHSISVSDIIALKINGIVSSYYVDSFGFKEQSHFLPAQNYLETAEKTLEQNYNQIDCIINNKASVEELEQTVKTGGSISLLDLANAVQAEKKKISVVEQLKTKPTIEKEKHKKAPQIGVEMER